MKGSSYNSMKIGPKMNSKLSDAKLGFKRLLFNHGVISCTPLKSECNAFIPLDLKQSINQSILSPDSYFPLQLRTVGLLCLFFSVLLSPLSSVLLSLHLTKTLNCRNCCASSLCVHHFVSVKTFSSFFLVCNYHSSHSICYFCRMFAVLFFLLKKSQLFLFDWQAHVKTILR